MVGRMDNRFHSDTQDAVAEIKFNPLTALNPTYVGFFVYRHLGLVGCNIVL